MPTDTCYIFGAGPFYGLDDTPQPGDHILAADGGYLHCQALALRPTLLLGDFDSLQDRPRDLPTETFPVDKDDTDTMLAIKIGLSKGCRTFHLYGGTGGRMDHTLANLQGLAYLAQRGARGYLHNEQTVFTALWNNELSLPAREEGLFSVFCLGPDARRVTISGGRYPLEQGTLSAFFPLGVSNHFQGSPVHISVESGCLLVGWER